MLTFTDPYLFAKGTSTMRVSRPGTGKLIFVDNATQTANVEPNINMGEVRGGLMNGILTMLPQEPGFTCNFTSAQYNLVMKAEQLGAQHGYGIATRTCVAVTAAEGAITVPIATAGTPVAGPGYSDIFCYVQEIGAESSIINDGVAYPIDPTSGVVSGYTPTNGKQYKVHFWVNKATTEYAKVSAFFDPSIVHVEIETPIFSNKSGEADNSGTRVGTHITIIPYLKLGGNGGMNGDQTGNDTTSVSGTAIAYQNPLVVDDCGECGASAADLVYYLYVPCDDADMIDGLVYINGEISIPAGGSAKLNVYAAVKGNLVPITDYNLLSFEITETVTGMSVSADGVVATGNTQGEGVITATYAYKGETYTVPIAVSVV